MILKKHIKRTGLIYAFSILLFSPAITTSVALAQNLHEGELVDILPAKSVLDDPSVMITGNGTHPAVKLTPDRSEIIRLEKPAASVIVGNPDHLSVLSENTTTLVFIPKLPGATFVTILDKNSNIIMQRHVIVATPKEKYIRIRRSCAGLEEDECQPTRVFYCPDMCHEVSVTQPGESTEESTSSPDTTQQAISSSTEETGEIESN